MNPNIYQDMCRRASEPVMTCYLCLLDEADSPFARTSSHRSQCNTVIAGSDDIDLEEEPIVVERTEAKHNMDPKPSRQRQARSIQEYSGNQTKVTLPHNNIEEQSQYQIPDSIKFPHMQLTRMKWLTDGTDSTVASSPSISPSTSVTSTSTNDSLPPTDPDRYLSKILNLDREYQMFGLSNLPMDWSSRRKEPVVEERPVFYQTAIVQVCCARARCRHKSNSDLPTSLKCGGCRSCMLCPEPVCPAPGPCAPPCGPPPPSCVPSCYTCPKGKCTCKKACRPPKCYVDCSSCYGMKITLNKKPKVEPPQIEIIPRASCVLGKPLAARPCTHCPPCIPPSSCFPYLMPCFWPSRSGAPCNDPARCFHQPPCPAPRKRRPCDHKQPTGGKCNNKKTTCSNKTCPHVSSR